MKNISMKSLVIGAVLGAGAMMIWSSGEPRSEAQVPRRATSTVPVITPQQETTPENTPNYKRNPKLVTGQTAPVRDGNAPVVAPNYKRNPKLVTGQTAPVRNGNAPVVAPNYKKNPKLVTSQTAPVRDGSGKLMGVPDKKKEFPGASAQWKRGFDTKWIDEEKERHEIKAPADNKALVTITGSQKDGHGYGNYTAADILLWEKETERLVVEGSLIFHNADLLGSTNGTSCDMCHPDGEGTHAETYPKYQVQLGRAALLRDMANWCLENPCRAEPMSGDDPRMRALEAYMQAQRSGKLLKYGKH